MRLYFWPALAGVAGVALTLLVGWTSGAKMNVLTGDIFMLTRTPPFVALLSNVGAFAWFAAVTLILFTLTLPAARAGGDLKFLVCSLAISTILFVDDFFMLHDYWIRILFGKVDAYYYGVLAALMAAYLVAFRRTILSSAYRLLLAALTFFAASIAMDVVQELGQRHVGHWQYLAEDGAKWFGVCFWLAYFFTICRDISLAPPRGGINLPGRNPAPGGANLASREIEFERNCGRSLGLDRGNPTAGPGVRRSDAR